MTCDLNRHECYQKRLLWRSGNDPAGIQPDWFATDVCFYVYGKQRIKNKLQFLEDLYGKVQELSEKGHSEKAVIKTLDPKQDRGVKWLTMGNVSFANMIRSALATSSNH